MFSIQDANVGAEEAVRRGVEEAKRGEEEVGGCQIRVEVDKLLLTSKLIQ